MTRYNHKDIQYDGIGNPLTDGTWTYSWDCRQLASMTDGTTTWSYKYNGDGLRTERSNGTTTYEYVYSGSSLVQMTVGSNVLRIAYDGSAPMTVTYNGTVYYYVTNLQGDVVAILDSTGTAVVQYTYDAWGKELTVTGSAKDTLGAINPLRYRGYVYDPETGRYYLQSRYYDPKMGRFINADAYASTGQGLIGNNMFAYCNNNPVNCYDPSGAISYTCFGDEFLLSDKMLNSDGGGGIERTTIATSRQASKDFIVQEAQRVKNIAYLYPLGKTIFGLYQVSTGFGVLALPWPGLWDEIKGWNKIRKGFWHIVDAIEITWELLEG